MARYTGAVCKLCRREGKKLFLKGERCTSTKCAFEHRSYAPGQHGQARKKNSEYGTQLRAKQTARRYYGLNESQFYKYFLMAERQTGMTGENLLRICESRLDVVAIKKASLDSDKFKAILEKVGTVPAWLELGDDNTAKVVDLPTREQIEVPVEEHLIVELYSK